MGYSKPLILGVSGFPTEIPTTDELPPASSPFYSLSTAIQAASGAINTTETILAQLTLTGKISRAGMSFRIRVYGTNTSTAAVASNLRLRLGTAGTVADAVVAVITPTSATTGTNNPFFAEFIITFRTLGSSGTVVGVGHLVNNGAIGITSAATGNVVATPTTATVSTTAALILSVTFASAAATNTSTFQAVVIDPIF